MGVMAKKIAAAQGAPDAEDANEPPETPGEVPDAEDRAEGPEPDADASSESPTEDKGEGGEGSESNVSPEEQALYDAVVLAANAMIYGKDTGKLVIQRIHEAKGSAQGLGHLAAMIILSIREGAKKQGREIPDDVLFHAGQEVVANLVELTVAAGYADQSKEEELFKQTVFAGLKTFGEHEAAAGELTQAKRNQAAGDLQQFTDQNGDKSLVSLAQGNAGEQVAQQDVKEGA